MAGVATALCLVNATGAWAQSPPPTPALPTPIEAFFGRPLLDYAKLAPSGRWLASLVAQPGQRTRLVVSDLEDKVPATTIAAFSKHDVTSVTWVNDDLLVFQAYDNLDRSRESRHRSAGLLSVRRDGEGLRLLIKRDWEEEFPRHGPGPLEANHRFLSLGTPGSDEVLVGEYQYDAGYRDLKNVRLLTLNARTGERRGLVNDAPPNVTGWWFDTRSVPRIALSRQGSDNVLFWRDPADQRWREFYRAPRLRAPFWPSFIDGAGRIYVTWTDKDGVDHLSKLDPSTAKPDPQPVVSIPGFDSDIDALVDPVTRELVGLSLLTDDVQQVWLPPSLKAMQDKVDQTLPGRINQMTCAPCDQPKAVLVRSYSDRHPGEYVVHRPEGNRWTLIGTRRPAIDPDQMGRKAFHRIQARDGADLPVWVTLPAGPATGPRAAVVLVHGGPWVRGAQLGWDAESQFLASRGYVVIEPEFRGSRGYGEKHYRAGWKQWGQAMQDDVTDALQFAVRKGWADAGRVCIAGASYGGYSALMGLAKTPEQYRCGVATVAVSDPRLMFDIHWSDISDDVKTHTMPEMIGDLVKDAAMLAANAPLELASRIKAPVMLTYGALDRRVPLAHGEQMQAALVKAGNPAVWHVYGNEGHSFEKDYNVIDYWRRVETFLARHLKP